MGPAEDRSEGRGDYFNPGKRQTTMKEKQQTTNKTDVLNVFGGKCVNIELARKALIKVYFFNRV